MASARDKVVPSTGLTSKVAGALTGALGTKTIDDLACWPPQATARKIVAEAAGQSPRFDADKFNANEAGQETLAAGVELVNGGHR